jgi:hypothetical protein
MGGLMAVPGIKRINIKPQCDRFVFPDGHGVIVLAEGRLLNLGCATGHPSFVMSCSFTNQCIAQLELWAERTSGKYEKKVYVLPKHLDEKVAALHLPKLGAKLTKLTKDQAEYINVPVEGPYKPAYYRRALLGSTPACASAADATPRAADIRLLRALLAACRSRGIALAPCNAPGKTCCLITSRRLAPGLAAARAEQPAPPAPTPAPPPARAAAPPRPPAPPRRRARLPAARASAAARPPPQPRRARAAARAPAPAAAACTAWPRCATRRACRRWAPARRTAAQTRGEHA